MLTTPGHEKPPGAETLHARPRALSNDRARAVPTKRRNGMSFSDHKITAFTHKIADLPDQPNLPADELKGRFDSSPEELRQSLNSICDDADALTIRVDQHGTQLNQIAMDKFPDDTIKESNLHPELAAKINGMEDDIEALGAQKCEVYFGTYTGDSTYGRHINIGFAAKAVLIIDVYASNETTGQFSYCGLGLQGNPLTTFNFIELDETGFKIYGRFSTNKSLNMANHYYAYIAFM